VKRRRRTITGKSGIEKNQVILIVKRKHRVARGGGITGQAMKKKVGDADGTESSLEKRGEKDYPALAGRREGRWGQDKGRELEKAGYTEKNLNERVKKKKENNGKRGSGKMRGFGHDSR